MESEVQQHVGAAETQAVGDAEGQRSTMGGQELLVEGEVQQHVDAAQTPVGDADGQRSAVGGQVPQEPPTGSSVSASASVESINDSGSAGDGSSSVPEEHEAFPASTQLEEDIRWGCDFFAFADGSGPRVGTSHAATGATVTDLGAYGAGAEVLEQRRCAWSWCVPRRVLSHCAVCVVPGGSLWSAGSGKGAGAPHGAGR